MTNVSRYSIHVERIENVGGEMGTMLYSMVETRICRGNINTNGKFDRDEIYCAFVLYYWLVDNLIRYYLGLNKYR